MKIEFIFKYIVHRPFFKNKTRTYRKMSIKDNNSIHYYLLNPKQNYFL